jgi:hypothetical protein
VELGLNARSLNSLPLDEQMLKVADALKGVENQSDRVRLAFKLFDSEGVAILQTMEDGSQSFRDAAEDLRRLGGVMTAQGTANAEEFNDQMLRVKTAFNGLSLALATEFIPILAGVAKRFAEFVADNRESVVTFIRNSIVGFLQLGIIIGQVVDKIRKTSSDLFDSERSAETLTNILQGVGTFVTEVLKMFIQLAPLLAKALIISFKASWSAFVSLARNAWQAIKSLFGNGDFEKTMAQVMAEAVVAAGEELAALGDVFGSAVDIVIDKASAASTSLAETFGINTEVARAQAEAMLEGIARFGEATEELRNQQEENSITFIEALRERMANFLSEQGDLTTAFAEEMFNTIMSTTQAIGDGFAQVVVDGKKFSEVFKQIAKQVAKEIIATIIRMKLQHFIALKSKPAEAGANALASMSAAPFPLNLTAPAVAAKHAAKTATFVAGAAHGGLDFVPRESTFLLNRGERVLSPQQNTDLTSFLRDSEEVPRSGIGDVTVNIYTTASNFEDVTDEEVEEFVAGRVIRALDKLDDQGVKLRSIERANL